MNRFGLGLLNFNDFAASKVQRQMSEFSKSLAGVSDPFNARRGIAEMTESVSAGVRAANQFREMNEVAEQTLKPQKVFGIAQPTIALLAELTLDKDTRVMIDMQPGIMESAKHAKQLLGPALPSPPILVSEGMKVLHDTGWRRSVVQGSSFAVPEIVGATAHLQELVFPRAFVFLHRLRALEDAAETARRLREQQLCEEVLNANDMAAMKGFTRERVELPDDYWGEVAQVLGDSGWRDTTHPFRYIRYLAKRYGRQRWREENAPLIRSDVYERLATSCRPARGGASTAQPSEQLSSDLRTLVRLAL